jgi:TonB family protein
MRRSFTLCSIVVHAVVITAALIAQVVADGALPTPHRPTIFDTSQFMPVDIQMPKPRAAPQPRNRDGAIVSANAAPLVSPTGLAPETGREDEVTSPPAGSVIGIEGGPPPDITGVGIPTAAPPPPPEPTAPMHLHSGMKAPVKTTDVAPVYPLIAKQAHLQGVVILEAVLDAQGRVESVRVLRSIPQLDRAAVDAVQQWRFTPALLNGQAVPVVMTVTVNFMLQ